MSVAARRHTGLRGGIHLDGQFRTGEFDRVPPVDAVISDRKTRDEPVDHAARIAGQPPPPDERQQPAARDRGFRNAERGTEQSPELTCG
ncbi:hypothetical protein ACFQ07_23265, partial [Actinomadura adrarensis]